MRLAGEMALVTGSTSGIGKHVALVFALLLSEEKLKRIPFRARAIVKKSPDDVLMAYSNPIRIVLGR